MPPQRSHLTWKSLVFLSIPLWIYFLITLGETFASSLPWYRSWQPVVLVVGGILVASMVQKRIRLRQAGFKPSRPGFSGEIDILAEKLRNRLSEVDRAVRFRRVLEPLPREFAEFGFEVIQTALVVDKKEILPHWKALQQQDEEIRFQLELKSINPNMEVELEKKLESYRLTMMNAVEELQFYSQAIRSKGGLYKISKKEMIVSSMLIVLFSGSGVYLIWNFWPQRTWPFWIGILGVAGAGIILALLIGVLKDQESSR